MTKPNKYAAKVTPEMAQSIKEMSAAGVLQKDIAEHHGVSCSTIQCVLHPEYRKRKNEWRKEYQRQMRRMARHETVQSQADLEAEWRKQLPHIPTPRTLNQILLGDPCEGRSALDQRQGA